jgi:hypothetical protein
MRAPLLDSGLSDRRTLQEIALDRQCLGVKTNSKRLAIVAK